MITIDKPLFFFFKYERKYSVHDQFKRFLKTGSSEIATRKAFRAHFMSRGNDAILNKMSILL